jgi:polyhydroxyalkanoate synthesis regulator protein
LQLSQTIYSNKENIMLTLKKYANGRLYDTANKQYMTKDQLSTLIAKKEKIRVVLAKTGKDVTSSVVASLSTSQKANTNRKNKSLLEKNTIKKRFESHQKWIVKRIDKGMDTILEMMSFPSKQQVTKLNAELRELSHKLDDLQERHAKARQKMKLEHRKAMKNLLEQCNKATIPADTKPAAQAA